MRWTILLVALATLTAGCFGGNTTPLSEEEAKVVAEDALNAFATDFASPDGGDLTTVSGEFGFGSGNAMDKATFFIEWGTGGSTSVSLSTGGSFGVEIKLLCDPGSVVIDFGGETVEARPQPGKACMESFQDTGDPLELGEFENLDLLQITPHKDRTVTAVYKDDEGNITIKIDAKGRITRMDLDTGTGSGFMQMGYGNRRAIALPDAEQRMPALINGIGSHDGTVYTWSGLGGEASEPFSEFEVRVLHPESKEVLAAFPVGQDGSAAGFTFTFMDDGDGVFDGGDSFTISHEAWTSNSQYQVVVWDRWADRALGDIPIPSIGGLLLVGLLGAALVARR